MKGLLVLNNKKKTWMGMVDVGKRWVVHGFEWVLSNGIGMGLK